MNELLFLVFENIDPAWVRGEALKMMEAHKPSERSNSSGKFFHIYECWHFHKSSHWPLIQLVEGKIKTHAALFQKKYNKVLCLDFFVLSRVTEFNSPVSLWHKDGYFFDGQVHLTISGNAHVEYRDRHQEGCLVFPNGQLWYLNGTRYEHRVPAIHHERIELCAPVNQLVSDVEKKMLAVALDGSGWVDGNSAHWTELRKQQTEYVKKAVATGKASNKDVADFSVEFLENENV